MNLGIAGRKAAVAAASRGLGLATARALAAEGVTVAICGRDAATVDAAASLRSRASSRASFRSLGYLPSAQTEHYARSDEQRSDCAH